MAVRKCSWCGKFLGDGRAPEGEFIRGGVCESCLDRFEEDLGMNEEQAETSKSGIGAEETLP